jgi:hypothetical protein
MTWFLLGSTANFNRSLDLIGTLTLVIAWIPSLFLQISSLIFLRKGVPPASPEGNAILYIKIILLFVFPIFLFQGVNTAGWLSERKFSDSLKTTSDQKYEYRIDLINLFQKDSRGRLYIRNLSTGEVKQIPVGIHTEKIIVLGQRSDYNEWVLMEPTNRPDQYYLFTTKDLSLPKEEFEIDVGTGTSRSLQ